MERITRNWILELRDLHSQSCIEVGDHPDEVSTALSAGADALERIANIDAAKTNTPIK